MSGNKKMKYFNEVFQKSSTGRGWSEGENKKPRMIRGPLYSADSACLIFCFNIFATRNMPVALSSSISASLHAMESQYRADSRKEAIHKASLNTSSFISTPPIRPDGEPCGYDVQYQQMYPGAWQSPLCQVPSVHTSKPSF